MTKEQIEYMDEDFLGNKINIGDTVIFEAPKYRDFAIGKVVTKAPKSCQIEYVNNWNYSQGKKEIVRQYYGQVIKHPTTDAVEVRHGEWLFNRGQAPNEKTYYCSLCAEGESDYGRDNYCPNCGAKMERGK